MNSTAQMLQIGLQLHEAGRLDEARQCYETILQSDPEHADAHHLLGMLAYRQGDHEAAVIQIIRALTAKPANALYLTNLGGAYRALDRYDEAQQALERAIEIQPGYVEPCNNLGTVLFAQGKFTEARQCYETALSLKPEYPDAYINLGSVHHALCQFDAAEESLRNALRLAPGNPLAWNNLGNVFKSRDRLAEAVDCYQQALSSDPHYGPARNNLAVALQAQGQWEAAIEAFEASSSAEAAPGLLIKRALALRPGRVSDKKPRHEDSIGPKTAAPCSAASALASRHPGAKKNRPVQGGDQFAELPKNPFPKIMGPRGRTSRFFPASRM